MNVMELGQKMVEMVNGGKTSEREFVNGFYADNIVSIEGGGDDSGMPQRMEGMEAIIGKHDWFYDNNEVHATLAVGPYMGHRDDQFVVRFNIDMTPKGGERSQLEEVGLYTVANNKIVQEEYLYLMG